MDPTKSEMVWECFVCFDDVSREEHRQVQQEIDYWDNAFKDGEWETLYRGRLQLTLSTPKKVQVGPDHRVVVCISCHSLGAQAADLISGLIL